MNSLVSSSNKGIKEVVTHKNKKKEVLQMEKNQTIKLRLLLKILNFSKIQKTKENY